MHKWMQGRRHKYLDPISSPCEGIGELKYRPQESTFNASDREFLFRTWVTGGIDEDDEDEKILKKKKSDFTPEKGRDSAIRTKLEISV